MLAKEVFEMVDKADYLNCNRSGTAAILEHYYPEVNIQFIDDFPFQRVAEVPPLPVSAINKLNARGCECLIYGNATKAAKGEGSYNIVVRF
ncbi:hypothetical protein M0R72_20930 [Candidatus Pacearchaeota archaeon]|jgi:hypothetical protein|nr:hypothetical protein [Candidatus Pacearchaeota archaeon]